MSFKVVNPKKLVKEAEQLLADNGIEVINPSGPTKKDLLDVIPDADAIIVFLSPEYTIDKEIIDAGRNLKLIARFGAGLDNVDTEYAKEKGILVSYTPTSNSNSVAELTLYHIISLAKNSRIVDKRIHAGEFNEIKKLSAVELEGKTLGLIGNGNIAKLVAKKAKYGFDMTVIGYNPHETTVFPDDIERVDSLDDLLEKSDFVSIHVPLTSETKGMIGRQQLAKMKDSAFLINTARGNIVDEAALLEALKKGVIAGAGLDVFENEPLGETELKNLDNVILTPHYGGFTKGAVAKTGIQVAQSVISVSKGEIPEFLYIK